MLLEEIAKQRHEDALAGRQGENLDEGAVGSDDAFRLRGDIAHPTLVSTAHRPEPAASEATFSPANTPRPGRWKPVGSS